MVAFNRYWPLMLFCGVAVCVAEPTTNRAPSAVLKNVAGSYQFLSKLYYEGADDPARPRAVVGLYFTSMDCIPCRRDLPVFLDTMRLLAERGAQKGVRIVYYAINTEPLSRQTEMLAYYRNLGVRVDTELLLDPYRATCDRFGVKAFPHMVVISPRGRMTLTHCGASTNTVQLLYGGVREALRDEGARVIPREGESP